MSGFALSYAAIMFILMILYDFSLLPAQFCCFGCSECRLDIHFTVGTPCEYAAPFAEKHAAARQHVLRSLISLHNNTQYNRTHTEG
jgi:hypothetical protein